VAVGWAAERRAWLKARGIFPGLAEEERRRRYLAIRQVERRAYERLEARRFLSELDECHGRCELRDPKVREVLASALHFQHEDRGYCGDYVIMPNQGHWLVQPRRPVELENILHSVKRHSSLKVNRLMGRSGKLWQKESFDHIVRGREALEWCRSYIASNPQKAKLREHEYSYYRADWLDA
jgi:type I restriction enzyme R subunit